MRDIKFKGFHPDENGKEKVYVNDKWIKGYWVEGYYVMYPHEFSGGLKPHIFKSNYDEKTETGDSIGYPVIHETVSQYTGLKDKNGKEIFENDICVYEGDSGNGVVKWDEQDAMYVLAWKYNTTNSGIIWGNDCEVIGNIFSNPELIGGEKE